MSDDVLELLREYMEREGTPPLLVLEDVILTERLELVVRVQRVVMEEKDDRFDY